MLGVYLIFLACTAHGCSVVEVPSPYAEALCSMTAQIEAAAWIGMNMPGATPRQMKCRTIRLEKPA